MTRVAKALLLSTDRNIRLGTKMAPFGGHGYTQRILDEICRSNNIEDRFLPLLTEQLESAQFAYTVRAGNRSSRLNNKKIKSRLAKIEGQVAKLKNELERMHPQVFRECMTAYRELREEEMSKGAESRIRRAGIGERLPMNFEDFRQVPAILEMVCRTASRQMAPDTAGRNPDETLYVWVKLVSEFWIYTLNRSYTLDTHQKIPVTEAGKFLTECMMPLDPYAVPRLASQMRRFMDENPVSHINRVQK